ncbi:helix-turn-helix transcriptional regulator (plasmid) [Trichlorobacter lovleyi]|uniref:helix-turn-helix domain-containing protein n=1 Tax=Trichlorobacter lovleyi TaxID=313985 RepID=UPI00223F1A81|nr:helix-turn-helix transcriptional regulator [Trichlorobacter lovleyi]QOX81053.1 helix-turn-helix transcriptional regulator [Trichlorobacter lovleyi]
MTADGNHIDAEQSESACGDSKKIETESEKLQYILYSLRLTQVSFAQHLGISQTYVSALLRGSRQLSKKLTKKMFIVLQINPDWWNSNTGDPFLYDVPDVPAIRKLIHAPIEPRVRLTNELTKIFIEETDNCSFEEEIAAFTLVAKYLRTLKTRGILKVAYEENFDELMYKNTREDTK